MNTTTCYTKLVFRSAMFLVFVLLLTQTTEQSVITRRLQRAVSSESTTNVGSSKKPACLGRTPCGWAVYKPFTRRFDYYMENTCDCPTGKSCLRTDDDLSVSAYVYTCRAESSHEKGTEEATPLT